MELNLEKFEQGAEAILYKEASAEDKGVDLYVLERALLSMHHNSDIVFSVIFKAYKDFYRKGHQEVVQKYEEIRARGRKRTMVG
ncbi:EKC/KEOPS complex subunit TP53RK [Agrilus planipennis]|uniref:non-specific serine/threonine protein kinase n=1 Tax=Agrilus planipennis TaxID=224129 RepID=A0A1W4X6L4_AGRPL|nr:EKC/KEOPS complex subunit TP53RK [Agrilus planipennis]